MKKEPFIAGNKIQPTSRGRNAKRPDVRKFCLWFQWDILVEPIPVNSHRNVTHWIKRNGGRVGSTFFIRKRPINTHSWTTFCQFLQCMTHMWLTFFPAAGIEAFIRSCTRGEGETSHACTPRVAHLHTIFWHFFIFCKIKNLRAWFTLWT